jgi:hypothetical protein
VSTLVASDLDRTLIYSRKARALGADAVDAVCVEVHDGKDTSFVTATAARELTALAADAEFVPVTTRIAEQYRRVRLPGVQPRFAVVANGGQLLVDGQVDASWTRQVEKALADAFPLHSVWEQVGQVCHPEFTVKLRNAADLFCYAVVHPHRLPPGFVEDVAGWAAERGWATSLQGRKLYWVPAALTKSAAVAEVARRADCARVVAAGDSLLDVDLLLAADRGIHPRHGELYEQGWSAPGVERTATSGILAGEEIVAWFRTQVG